MQRTEPVRPDERIHNRLTGETITFQQTSADPDAHAVAFDVVLRPLGLPGGVAHRHRPTERFEVRSGRLLPFIAGRPPFIAREGEVFEVPAGCWHMIVALGQARARVTVTPAMRFDELLVVTAAVHNGDLRLSTLERLDELLREHDCAPRPPRRLFSAATPGGVPTTTRS